ncbi:MAG: class I SAM-dependent methyltransferase [Candidatus Brocadiales bacterium]
MLVKTRCNFCDTDDYVVLASIKVPHIPEPSLLVRCTGCGLAYMNPSCPVEEEKEFYAHDYYKMGEERHWHENRFPYFKQAFQRIEASFQTGRLLDVGCGKGYFLEMARKKGWGVYGVDPSQEAILFARNSLGLEVFAGELKDARLKSESFDVITAWNVLDHMYDPWGDVQEMSRVLKRGGLLGLRVLNLDFHLFLYYLSKTLGFITVGNLNISPLVGFHPHMFSPRCIKKWLKKAGFVDICVENSALVPGTASSVVGGVMERFLRDLTYSLANFCYYLSLHTLVVGPSLMVFARKP